MIRFTDLFCGVGGIRLALEQVAADLGHKSQCVLSCDIDQKARDTYAANFGETPFEDVRQLEKLKKHDVLLAGFPCQPFSYAGSRRGFGDTRGTLFFELERLIKESLPQLIVLENVRGLVSHDGGRTLQTVIARLVDLGYGVEYRVLNSADFGVAQNRMRVYIAAIRGHQPKISLSSREKFVDTVRAAKEQPTLFGQEKTAKVRDVLEEEVSKKFRCSDEFVQRCHALAGGDLTRLAGYRLIDSRNGRSIHSWDIALKGECTEREKELLDALVANRRLHKFGTHQDGKALNIEQIRSFFIGADLEDLLQSLLRKGYLRDDGSRFNFTSGNMSFEVFKILDPESISVTVVSSDAHKLGVVQGDVIRRLTPREVARLQGFPDSFELHPDDGAAYRQFGNSVSVPVVRAFIEDVFVNNRSALPMLRRPAKGDVLGKKSRKQR